MVRHGILVVLAGCSFDGPSLSAVVVDATAIDARPVDATVQPLPSSSVVLALTSASGSHVVTRAFDGLQLSAGCLDQMVAQPIAALAVNRAMPYAYGTQGQLVGVKLACSSEVHVTSAGAPSALQQISFTPSLSIGFFTATGGVWRYASNSDGMPNLLESDLVPTGAGPLLFAADAHELVVAGTGTVFSYALFGAGFALPHAHTSAPTCSAPRGIIEQGDAALVFCSDTATIRRYTLSPFAEAGDAGQLGEVDQIVPLDADHAVATVLASPAVAIVTLGNTPSWKTSPPLATRASALAVSEDGSTAAVALPLGLQTTLAIYDVRQQSPVLVTDQVVDGQVTAIAFGPTETP